MQNQPNTSGGDARAQALANLRASFLCPLSNQTMTDPVILVADGKSYERSALVNGGVNPVTGEALLPTHYVPNTNLRAMIQLVGLEGE